MAHGLNESEYRRGLVLGLTLAEVLLLLLFLVLLALTALYQAADQRTQSLKDDLAALRSKYATSEEQRKELAKALDKSEGGDTQQVARAISFYRKLQELVPEPQVDDVIHAIQQAAQIDPASPPTVLIEGANLVRTARLEAKKAATAPRDPEPTPAPQENKKEGHDWPPMIALSEADGHSFVTGSAEVPPALRDVLKGKVVDRLREIIAEFNVDVIEVVGHTDDQAIVGYASNLDLTLGPVVGGNSVRDLPRSADNAGLGLARAASVVRILRQNDRLKDVEIIPLSGGQLIDVGDRLAAVRTGVSDARRRRIEIRLRRRAIESRPIDEPSLAWASQVTSAPETVGSVPLAGTARIVDGDTIDIGSTRVRLWGVDAIEGEQVCILDGKIWGCGGDITKRLATFVADGRVECEAKDTDQYQRTVAICTVRGVDLGAWLVGEGLALDYRRFSNGFYHDQQIKAQATRRGIWRSEFMPPWEWRQTTKQRQPR